MFELLLDRDRVEASVHILKWKWIWRYDETPEQCKERLENARGARQEVIKYSCLRRGDERKMGWNGAWAAKFSDCSGT
jgi:hypothetical protein